MTFAYYSTKTYHEAFPVAYRQHRAESHCNHLHGYALTIHVEFGTNELDARNWVVDFGSLKPLKGLLEDWFDHTLLVAQDDPCREQLIALGDAGLAKIVMVEATGCEAISKFVLDYINDCWLKDYGYAGRVTCTRVEVRETQANMAMAVKQ